MNRVDGLEINCMRLAELAQSDYSIAAVMEVSIMPLYLLGAVLMYCTINNVLY